ncbi:MAG: Asp-tRNA(Asn)/Glu-tRNA(Gln) amidotransferase subunit GatA [Deltaproteobacteria bacterium]|nr:MAG: Asp-tRNA(Asn)/Glu-tRNA(Gln) amidotransferase subunit GatA [Deltaproteobacteria bacterium]
MTAPTNLPLCEGVLALASGELSSVEWTQACLERIQAWDATLGCFLHVLPEDALRAAEASDTRRAQGQRLSPLDGVPLGVKDVFHLPNAPTTCGSRFLEGYQPPFVSSVCESLLRSGVVPLGKLNLDEFAMGSSTEFSAYKRCRNPWDLGRTPGGSSGGCASALAARLVGGALGSDTGGSVRQPAAFCGVTGFKPTYGRVSRFGLVSFAPSMDQAGVMAHSAQGCAWLLQAIAGLDPNDATTQDVSVPNSYLDPSFSWQGLRIGLPREFWDAGMEPCVRKSVLEALEWMISQGAAQVSVSLPRQHLALETYLVLASAEAFSNLSRFDGVRLGQRRQHTGDNWTSMIQRTRSEGLGPEVQRRITMGSFVLSKDAVSDYYEQAQKVRSLLASDYAEAWGSCDLLLTPTTPTSAFCLGDRLEEPLAMYQSDLFTVGANLAGLPALSMPVGFTSRGLPVAAQLLAPAWEEQRLLSAAHSFQQAFDHHLKVPVLSSQGSKL